jgi:hypothetical protein
MSVFAAGTNAPGTAWRLLPLGFLLAGGAAGHAITRGDPGASTDQRIEIRLNGSRLGQGLVLGGRAGGSVWVRVVDLQRAVDGSAAPVGRLRHSGRELRATDTGGCVGCPLRVVRAVLVSSRVRVLVGEPHLPLDDVARALEARGSLDAAADRYNLHAGECRWCILAPAGEGGASRAPLNDEGTAGERGAGMLSQPDLPGSAIGQRPVPITRE